MKGPLDSRQLQAFLILARTGSFTQTAREMFLTQSAVSHSMRALENDVGCRLLDRVGKKVILTQAGEHLLLHAEKVLKEMEVARTGLEQMAKWGRGRLRLAAPATLCVRLLPPILSAFKQSFPQSLIAIEPGDAADVPDLLERGRVDLALALESKADDRFDFLPLFVDELVFIVSPQHPWAKSGNAPRADVSRETIINYTPGSQTNRLIESYFREEDIVLNTPIQLGSMEGIRELVKLNLGVAIVAPWVAVDEIARGTIVTVPLGRRKLRRTWGVLTWKSRRRSLPEETFIRLAREVGPSMMGSTAPK